MAYTKQLWTNGVLGGTPISATRLAYMETGIEAASRAGGIDIAASSGDQTTEINDAITVAAATNGRVTVHGTVEIYGRVIVPQGVDLWGDGNGQIHSGTTFKCMAADAGVSFGTRTTGGRAGVSGNFCVDGNNIATQPLYIGLTVQRTFINMESFQGAAGIGWLIEAAQNNLFLGCNVAHAAGLGLVLDAGAGGNLFSRCEFDSNNVGITIRETVSQPGYPEPTHNAFSHSIVERNATGCVNQIDGELTLFDSCILHNGTTDGTYPLVTCASGHLSINNSYVSSELGIYGTGITVETNGKVSVANTVFNAMTVVKKLNGSAVFEDQGGNEYFSCTTRTTGTSTLLTSIVRPVNAILGSIPLIAASSHSLTTSLVAVPGSYYILDPSHWTNAGEGLVFRVRATAVLMNPGETLEVTLFNSTDGIGLMSAFQVIAGTDGSAEAISPWTAFPATTKYGYAMARNLATATGIIPAVSIDVKAI